MSGLFGDSPLFSPSAFKSISALPTKAKISPTPATETGHAYKDDKLNIQLSDALEVEDESEFPSSLLLLQVAISIQTSRDVVFGWTTCKCR